MTWPNKRTIVILFMALAIGSQTMVSRPISFISMVISPKTAKAAETTAPEGYREANKIEYKSEDLRDPFQEEKIEIKEEPEVEIETKPLPGLQIQGIVWGGALPQAIINNKVVKIGDTIDQVQIINIAKSGITVLFENRKYNLSVPSASNLESPKKEPEPQRRKR